MYSFFFFFTFSRGKKKRGAAPHSAATKHWLESHVSLDDTPYICTKQILGEKTTQFAQRRMPGLVVVLQDCPILSLLLTSYSRITGALLAGIVRCQNPFQKPISANCRADSTSKYFFFFTHSIPFSFHHTVISRGWPSMIKVPKPSFPLTWQGKEWYF